MTLTMFSACIITLNIESGFKLCALMCVIKRIIGTALIGEGSIMSERPQPPEDWECCESECSPCVWDTYYEELRQWNAKQKALSDAMAEKKQRPEESDE